MADVFACTRGKVVVMDGCGGLPGKIVLGGFEPMAAIITSPSVTQRVNVQFQSSLKESVYVYVFGDQMGNVMINGIAFAARCQGDASGMKDIFDYYRDYRASQKKEPIEVTFGKEAISGFLTESNMSSRDPNNLTLDFRFTINTLPKKASS
jgi:hypothetical protein